MCSSTESKGRHYKNVPASLKKMCRGYLFESALAAKAIGTHVCCFYATHLAELLRGRAAKGGDVEFVRQLPFSLAAHSLLSGAPASEVLGAQTYLTTVVVEHRTLRHASTHISRRSSLLHRALLICLCMFARLASFQTSPLDEPQASRIRRIMAAATVETSLCHGCALKPTECE